MAELTDPVPPFCARETVSPSVEGDTVAVQLVVDPACNDEGIQDTVVVVDAADAGRVPTKDKHRNSNAGGTRNRHPLGCLAIGLIFSHVRMPRISTLRYKLSDFGPFPLTEVTDAGACSR